MIGRPPSHVGCTVEGCKGKHNGHGLCAKHLHRLKKHGSTELKTIEERFHDSYIPEPMSGCWLWTGTSNTQGYGTFYANGRLHIAHRFSWELHNGPIPEGMLACHHCDTPPCVNPDHLFVGTHKDNAQDSLKKGRHSRANGDHWNRSSITWDDIPKIKELKEQGLTYEEIGKQYGVGPTCIYDICKNRSWRRK